MVLLWLLLYSFCVNYIRAFGITIYYSDISTFKNALRTVLTSVEVLYYVCLIDSNGFILDGMVAGQGDFDHLLQLGVVNKVIIFWVYDAASFLRN